MFSSNQDRFNNSDNEQNPVVIGAVSAAAGIALGTAAAMYLSKKDNRKKLMDSLEVAKVRATDAIKTLVSKAENSTDSIETVKNNAKKLRDKTLTI